jgi:hypothetical protein
VLVCLDHVTSLIENADHSKMRAAVVLGVVDCVIDFGLPQTTEWQHIGNQIDAAFVFARAD